MEKWNTDPASQGFIDTSIVPELSLSLVACELDCDLFITCCVRPNISFSRVVIRVWIINSVYPANKKILQK
jgi:hypothetical protein